MSWIDKAEKRFGRYAIPKIVRPVVGFQILVYVLVLATNGRMVTVDGLNLETLEGKLILDPGAVLNGEVWRLFTFLFLPPTWHFLWFLIGVMFMLFVSESLENLWGAFRMNLYVLSGMFFLMLGAFLVLLSVGSAGREITSAVAAEYANSGALSLSLFLAFAVLFPNYEILAMLVVPIKAKWLGWIAGGFIFVRYLETPFALGRVLIIIGLMNFFVFAVPKAISAYRLRSDIATRRRRFEASQLPKVETFHECKRCGKSEVDDRDLEFRVTGEGKEYCVPCLEKLRAEQESAEKTG